MIVGRVLIAMRERPYSLVMADGEPLAGGNGNSDGQMVVEGSSSSEDARVSFSCRKRGIDLRYQNDSHAC
jgi:hypothetical protein